MGTDISTVDEVCYPNILAPPLPIPALQRSGCDFGVELDGEAESVVSEAGTPSVRHGSYTFSVVVVCVNRCLSPMGYDLVLGATGFKDNPSQGQIVVG